jgi:hypothetical protein
MFNTCTRQRFYQNGLLRPGRPAERSVRWAIPRSGSYAQFASVGARCARPPRALEWCILVQDHEARAAAACLPVP